MKSYLIIFLFFINPCIAMEQTNETEAHFEWNNGIMRDLRKSILENYLNDHKETFKDIFEKIKVSLPFVHTYGISPNGKYYATFYRAFANDRGYTCIQLYDLETLKSLKTFHLPEDWEISQCKKIYINDDGSWLIIEESHNIYSIPLEAEYQELEKTNYSIFNHEVHFIPEHMHFYNDQLIIAGKKKAGELKEMKELIDSSVDNNQLLPCIFTLENPKKSKEYSIYRVFTDSRKINFSYENKKLFTSYLKSSEKKLDVQEFGKIGKEFSLSCLPDDNPDQISISYDPILDNHYITTANRSFIYINDEDDKDHRYLFHNQKKFMRLKSLITQKKIMYGIQKYIDSDDLFLRKFSYENKNCLAYYDLPIPFLNIEKKNYNHFSKYLVLSPNAPSAQNDVELYPTEALSFLTNYYWHNENYHHQPSSFRDAQLFLLLSLEHAAQENKQIELKEIMRKGYDTMPCQIRKLYEHLVIKD